MCGKRQVVSIKRVPGFWGVKVKSKSSMRLARLGGAHSWWLVSGSNDRGLGVEKPNEARGARRDRAVGRLGTWVSIVELSVYHYKIKLAASPSSSTCVGK